MSRKQEVQAEAGGEKEGISCREENESDQEGRNSGRSRLTESNLFSMSK